MPKSVPSRSAIAFIDGQNLFHGAKEAFNCNAPNYDAKALSQKICEENNWTLKETRFYTGIHDVGKNPSLHHFWSNKTLQMTRQKIEVFTRPLRYRKKRVDLPNGENHSFWAAEEKGIDVRIAVDVIHMAIQKEYDVALIFSQDQDLSEVANEIRFIAKHQQRWIKVASAFPFSTNSTNKRGINGTDWIKIEKATYDACIDQNNYWPKNARKH